MTDILGKAKDIITGSRRETYGDPAQSFHRLATLWSAYLGAEVSALDTCNMLILLKVSREAYSHRQDNLIDICGYAALADELRKMENEQ